jgi:tetratricopeptide (TPR) repeat protein
VARAQRGHTATVRDMEANQALKHHIADLGLTQTELAHRLNQAIEDLTGRYGTVSERTIQYWTSGRHRSPHPKQGHALTAVFECTLEELGFHPPSHVRHNPAPQEDPVRRRAFLTSTATAVAGAAMPPLTAKPSVGSVDVIQMRQQLDALVSVDDQRGGSRALERAAAAGAGEVLELLKRSTTERTRQRLYSVAADFTVRAAFACIDSFALDKTQGYLDRAAAFAGLAQDSVAELSVWKVRSMLATYEHKPNDAVAAAQAGRRSTAARRDPFLASLISVAAASGYASLNDRQASLRHLDKARDQLAQAPDEQRPAWTTFFGLGQVEVHAAEIYEHFQKPEEAESAAFRALSMTPSSFRRNRASISLYLAKAQLSQGEVEQACLSAHQTVDLMEGDPLPGRMRTRLGEFHRSLIAASIRTPESDEWVQRATLEWSRQ